MVGAAEMNLFLGMTRELGRQKNMCNDEAQPAKYPAAYF